MTTLDLAIRAVASGYVVDNSDKRTEQQIADDVEKQRMMIFESGFDSI